MTQSTKNKLGFIFCMAILLFGLVSELKGCVKNNVVSDTEPLRAILTAEQRDNITRLKYRIVEPATNKTFTAQITAYDLSYQSCGKYPTSRGYGITRSGKSLKGQTWKVKAIAVDPKLIKLGTKVKLTFVGWRSKYSGIYTAVDTGGSIKGNKIDLFLGENGYDDCIKFGRVKARVEIIKIKERRK